MSLLPLIVSVVSCVDRVALRQNGGSCQFCGYEFAGWREYRFGRANAGDRVRACALCHLTQHLERPEIDREAILIWLPQMSQPALNRLSWRLYSILAEHGVGFNRCRPDGIRPDEAAGAVALQLELRALASMAARELGTLSPAELGEALSSMSPEAYAQRGKHLAGIRIFGLGQIYEDGRDIFPDFIGGGRAC